MGSSIKLYQSKEWMYRRYIIQRKTVPEIAKECNVSAMTIQRYVDQFGLSKKK
jgi:hypothetical protein